MSKLNMEAHNHSSALASDGPVIHCVECGRILWVGKTPWDDPREAMAKLLNAVKPQSGDSAVSSARNRRSNATSHADRGSIGRSG